MENVPSGAVLAAVLAAAAVFFVLGIVVSRLAKRGRQRPEKRGEQFYIKGLNYLLSNETDKAIEEFVRAQHLPGLTDYVWPSNGGKIAAHAKASVFVVRD